MQPQHLAFSIPGFTGASVTIAISNTVQCGTGKNDCLHTLSTGLTNLFFLVAIILSLAYLIWGGFDWITSGGDKTKLGKARLKLIYAIIGLIVVFFAYAIVNLIGVFLGLPLTINQ